MKMEEKLIWLLWKKYILINFVYKNFNRYFLFIIILYEKKFNNFK